MNTLTFLRWSMASVPYVLAFLAGLWLLSRAIGWHEWMNPLGFVLGVVATLIAARLHGDWIDPLDEPDVNR